MMFKNVLKLLGVKGPKADLADAVLSDAANAATGGAAGKVDDAVQAIGSEVKRRKKRG